MRDSVGGGYRVLVLTSDATLEVAKVENYKHETLPHSRLLSYLLGML